MIPSLNKKENLEKLYITSQDGMDPEAIEAWQKRDKSYFCDCCYKETSAAAAGYGGESWFWGFSWNPRLVKVKDVTYFGCSDACARALFLIHHQYAMRAAPQEGRFARDPMTGVTVDLDRVIAMQLKQYAEKTEVWFVLEGDRKILFEIFNPQSFARAEELVAAWKKRPSPKAFPPDPAR